MHKNPLKIQKNEYYQNSFGSNIDYISDSEELKERSPTTQKNKINHIITLNTVENGPGTKVKDMKAEDAFNLAAISPFKNSNTERKHAVIEFNITEDSDISCPHSSKKNYCKNKSFYETTQYQTPNKVKFKMHPKKVRSYNSDYYEYPRKSKLIIFFFFFFETLYLQDCLIFKLQINLLIIKTKALVLRIRK